MRSFLAVLLMFVLGLPSEAQKKLNLTILHTNDTHGHLLPYSYPETSDPSDPTSRLPTRRNIGGAARRATLVDRIRKEKGHATLVFDSGDFMDGSPFSTEYKGEADLAVMNAIGLDAAVLGNHEFNNTFEQVERLLTSAKHPIVVGNVKRTSNGELLAKPYVIKSVGGVRFGIFGLTTPSGQTYPGARTTVKIEDPVQSAGELVPELRKQCDIVIALTHIGNREDQELARRVPGIDVIVGGHSHTHLLKHQLIDSPDKQSGSINGTVIVQAFQWSGVLGRLDLQLSTNADGRWVVSHADSKLLPIVDSVPELPAVRKVVDQYWKPISSKFGRVLGEATDDFTRRGTDYAEYHFVADVIREEMGTEVHFENPGGVRSPIIKGTVTYGDMINVDPFGNTIVTFRVSGKVLKRILERAKPAVSGIRYTLKGGRLESAEVDGKPIEDDRMYRGSTNSFFASSDVASGLEDKVDTKRPRLDALVAYIEKTKRISPKYDGRRNVTEPIR